MEHMGLYALYKRLFALLAYNITFSYNAKMHTTKRELFRNVSKFANADGSLRLLEIGCGSGANFQFYPWGCTVICTDPNPHFHKYLRWSMDANTHLTYDGFFVVSGEDMKEVTNESVDVVVCTLVLCSVRNVQRVLQEVLRILKPGGAFYFLEHVVSHPSTRTYFFQQVLEPLWYYLADGCIITRATWEDLETAGFSEIHLKHIEAEELRPNLLIDFRAAGSRLLSAKMTFVMRFCAALVNVLCLPLHLMDAVGLYQIYKRIFPFILSRVSAQYNKKMSDEKRALFMTLPDFKKLGKQLTLLEIGCGTGTNFQFYPAGCKVICTDPNPNFQKYLGKAMAENGHLKYERFVVASGEDMGSIEDESVDAVVCTLVLCSVDNVAQTLREVHRILRQGGAFFFMEHVVADPSTWTYFLQHVLQPFWYYFGDGCRVTQETWKYLESAGFSELKMTRSVAPVYFLVRPHIIGYALK
ncbi:uncharacterized protein V6R79_016860 [Siganus canaliculatus]